MIRIFLNLLNINTNNSSVSSEKKNKFIYSLTLKGIDLVPVVVELMIWGSKYSEEDENVILNRIENDKEGFIKEYQEKHLKLLKDNN